MRGFKFRIVLFLFFIMILTGIFQVNVKYNRDNKPDQEKTVYNSKDNSRFSSYKADVYSEIVLLKNPDKKLKVYYRAKPFDLRFDTEKHVIYINRQAYDKVVDEKNKIINRVKDIISNGINSFKRFYK